MTAEEALAEVHKLATARLKDANIAAKHEGLVLVSLDRLAKLESLYELLVVATKEARMTREYKDVIEQHPLEETYNGKRYLLPREPFYEVLMAMTRIKKNLPLPMGCLVKG